MMKLRRTASKEWDVQAYGDAVTSALQACGRPGTLEMAFGPFSALGKQVTAFGLMRCLPLIEAFVGGGQRGAVIHGSRLEAAVVGLLASKPHLLGPDEKAEMTAHLFTNHVMAVLRTIRQLQYEDGCDATADRRFGISV